MIMQIQLVSLASTAYCNTFPSGHAEKHPYPISGQDVDPNKPACNLSCMRVESDPYFFQFFFMILSPIPDSAN